MALEQILVKISEDARGEAQSILDNALKSVDELLEEAKKEAGLLKDKIIATAQAEGEFAFRKEVIAKRLSAQKELLQAKKAQLDNCFHEALETLLNLDDATYRNLISNMLAKIDHKQEAEIIFSNSDKSRISQDYIHKTKPHLKLSFSDNIKGGFILKTKELNFDNSLDNILASLRQALEPKVAQILFKES